MNKCNNCVCVICNSQYTHALGEFVFNLKSINFPYDCIVVYHYDIDSIIQKTFTEIEPAIKFVEYSIDAFYKEHDVKFSNVKNLNEFINKYSHLTYIKYKVCEQLKNFKRVFYFDLDVLIRNLPRLTELFAIKGIAWRSSLPLRSKFEKAKDCKELSINKPKYTDLNFFGINDFDRNIPAPNAGMFVVTDDINYSEALYSGREFISKYIYNFTSYIDECCLSYMTAKNKLNLVELDGRIFNCFPLDVTKNTVVIHFAGSQFKPWSSKLIQTVFNDWQVNYQKFLRSSKFNPNQNFLCCDNIGDVLKEFIVFDKILNIINSLGFEGSSKIKYFDIKKNVFEINFNKYTTLFIYLNILSDRFSVELVIYSRIIAMNSEIKTLMQQISQSNKDILSIYIANDSLIIKTNELFEQDMVQIVRFIINRVVSNEIIKSYF